MRLSELILKHVDLVTPKFRHIDFGPGEFIQIITEDNGHYWAKNHKGERITVTPEMAEKGWSLLLQKRKEKWCAFFNRPVGASDGKSAEIYWVCGESHGFILTSHSGAGVFRLEQFDFEIEILE